MKKKGFTLIELLVVIAIIALLLSVLLPALSKVKERAKDLICRTNIKSIQLATILYTADNEGKMPEYQVSGGLWVDEISTYLEDIDDARYCPSTRINKAFNPADPYDWGTSKLSWVWNSFDPPPAGQPQREPEHGSYGLNFWFYTYTTPAPPYNLPPENFYPTMAAVKGTHMTPVFADSLWIDVGVNDTDTCPDGLNLDGSPNVGGRMSMHLINRHGSHINVGFADGHQQVVELGALWSLKWHPEFTTTAWMDRVGGSPIYPGPR